MVRKNTLSHRLALAVMAMTAFFSLNSCSDDVSFPSDPSLRLDFSSDTLSFDTVFTSVGSSTDCFLIYNRNDAGVKLDARLCGGSSSPFRINVDGQSGTVIDGLEIRPNDSIYCFVSVNIDPHDSDSPLLEMDSVRFTTAGGVVQQVLLTAYGQDVVRLENITFTEDERLTSARPYLIFDTLRVAETAVLTIDRGSRLYFHDGAVLRISGRVVADGTCDSMIVMCGDRIDNMLSGIPYDLTAGRWGGVVIDSCSFGNRLTGCNIHSSTWGVVVDTSVVDREKIFIDGSIIHNVKGNALQLTNSMCRVYNSQITNAGGHCVDILGGKQEFLHCTIANFYPWSQRESAVFLTNCVGDVLYPLLGADFINCIITGYDADEFMGSVIDSVPDMAKSDILNYSISHSLVKTVDTLDVNYKDNAWDLTANPVHGTGNFRMVEGNDFMFDFHLDSLSLARGIAGPSALCPYDITGVERPGSSADAGCYQYCGN